MILEIYVSALLSPTMLMLAGCLPIYGCFYNYYFMHTLEFFILFVHFDTLPCYNGLPAFSIVNGTPEDKFCC